MWEEEAWGRIGFEWYYTGRQQLDDNPYRARSPGYALFGVLVERRFGPARFFLNSENLGNIRQTRFDPLVRPTREPGGGWTVDAWAPLDGRVFNGGVRIVF
jgi:iron complex outermembrane receptor protein